MFASKTEEKTSQLPESSTPSIVPPMEQTKNEDVAFLFTYPAEKGLGHAALAWPKDPSDPNSPLHHLSLYPANSFFSKINNFTRWPVPGKLIDNPEQDAKYEQTEPEVVEIKGVNTAKMTQFKEELQKDLTKQSHLFTISHNSHNPWNYLKSFFHLTAKTNVRATVEPELNPFPSSDDLITASLQEGAKPLNLSNCATVVEDCLGVGGLDVKHHGHPALHGFFKSVFSRTPQTTQAAVLNSGGKMIKDGDQVPTKVKAAMAKGRQFEDARKKDAPPAPALSPEEDAIKRVTNSSI